MNNVWALWLAAVLAALLLVVWAARRIRVPKPYQRFQIGAAKRMPAFGPTETGPYRPRPGEQSTCASPTCKTGYLLPGQTVTRIPLSTGVSVLICSDCSGTPRMKGFA